MSGRFDIIDKIQDIHENQVRAGWVDREEHYIYSSDLIML
jgi:hypothetical protein